MSETLHLTCPACSGVNRVLADKLAKAPTCGRCAAPLVPTAPMELDGPALDRMIARDGLPLVVDFWSASCGPCRMMAPAFAEAARLLAPGVRAAKVQTDRNPDAAMRRSIQAVPTIILYRGGAEIARSSGAMDAMGIASWVRLHL